MSFLIIKYLGIYLLTSILASCCFGYAFLKAYDLFKAGIKENCRWKIWSAFSSATFVVVFFITFITKALK